jgi:hypothetical protein
MRMASKLSGVRLPRVLSPLAVERRKNCCPRYTQLENAVPPPLVEAAAAAPILFWEHVIEPER